MLMFQKAESQTLLGSAWAMSERIFHATVRNVRQAGMQELKKAKADGLSEDEHKLWSDEVQEMTNRHIALIDKSLETKQQEIMQV